MLLCFSPTEASPVDIYRSDLLIPSIPSLFNGLGMGTIATGGHPHFTIQIFPAKDRLETLPMLMNIVESLGAIALSDQSTRTRGWNYESPDFPGIKIAMVPKGSAQDFTYEVASLCLYYGSKYLIRRNLYLEATFSCKWDHVEVARVDIDKSSPLASPKDPSLETLTAPNTTMTKPPSNSDVTPQFNYLSGAQRLNLDVVFMTFLTTFAQFSAVRKADIVPQGPIYPSEKFGAYFSLATLARLQPPFFDYEVLIRSLVQAPHYMIDQGRFGELAMSFRVDGVLLGTGNLIKGSPATGQSTGGGGGTVETA
ncbi:MAG: hypothetical protein Q9219_004962 [cf. Caloplaca sp. 3 TL-2023]